MSILAIGPVPGWGLAGLVGLLPLVNGLTGFCLAYALLGIDTRQRSIRRALQGSHWTEARTADVVIAVPFAIIFLKG